MHKKIHIKIYNILRKNWEKKKMQVLNCKQRKGEILTGESKTWWWWCVRRRCFASLDIEKTNKGKREEDYKRMLCFGHKLLFPPIPIKSYNNKPDCSSLMSHSLYSHSHANTIKLLNQARHESFHLYFFCWCLFFTKNKFVYICFDEGNYN